MSGRVALVTGGSRGIGKAIAKALIRDGCRVVIADVDQESLASCEAELNTDGNVKAVCGDVTSHDDVAAAVKSCVETFGNLHILVNNA
ncbi:MAG: SDR family NAD(P)-dependent oxidoreductase, partial [bacterium]